MTLSSRIGWRMLTVAAIAAALAVVLFVVIGGAARAVVSPSVDKSSTVVLTDKPGGGGAREQLFKVGGVVVAGRCEANQDGTVLEMLTVRNGTNHVVMLATGDASQVLPPGEDEALTADEPDTRGAAAVSFALLDERGISASGTGAESVNPGAHRCVFTAQVAG